MAVRPAWIEALRPVPGSARLVVARVLLFVLSAVPGLLVGQVALGDAIGRRPYFADAADPLPIVAFAELVRAVPGAVFAVLAGGALLAWLGNQLLTAGAVVLLDPRRRAEVRVWRAVFDTGTRFLWVYLRIALLALLLLAAGGAAARLLFATIIDHGTVAGWSQKSLVLTLPFVRTAVLLGWASLVGVLAWWCRVVAVADGRRLVRRLPGLVVRVWRRRPLQGVAFHVALGGAGLLAGSGTLFAWRQSSAGTAGWLVLWLAVLLLQSTLWHWRLRAACLLWAAPDFDGARRLPDEPWGVVRALRERLRGGGRRRPAPEADSATPAAARVRRAAAAGLSGRVGS